MRVLGVDLAWSDIAAANETGVVALDRDGVVAAAGWTTGVDATRFWIEQFAEPDTAVFVDAPMLVLNGDKQRLCEREVGRAYGRWQVSANSTNRSSPRLAGVRLRELMEAAGWTYLDGTEGPRPGRTMSECYPYTTIVGTAELGYDEERPRYKRKPRRMPVAEWRPIRAAACDGLVERMLSLRSADPPLDLRSHPVTAKLIEESSPLEDRLYKHREDLIDASLAAWTAALWQRHGASRCQVLGATDALVDERGARATIIAPARPEQRLAT